jgi:hypothetical protein
VLRRKLNDLWKAAQRDEVFKAMQQAGAERIEAKTMRLRALRLAKATHR